jgi:hypothetical protein
VPTKTYAITSSTDDQLMEAGGPGTSWPPATATRYTNLTVNGPSSSRVTATEFYKGHTLLRFDSSSDPIPSDATIDSAYIELRIGTVSRVAADNPEFWIGYYNWDGSSSSDYTTSYENDAHSGTNLTAITADSINQFALQNLSNIAKSGITEFRTHVRCAGGAAPTSFDNKVNHAFFDDATNQEPRLVVTFTTGWSGRTPPDAIIAKKGLVGTLADIDEDPDSADGNWLVVG